MGRLPGWVFVAGLVALLSSLPLLGIHVARDHQHCMGCGSDRTINQWRWGAYWPEQSWKLSGTWKTSADSRFFQDWVALGHPHEWMNWKRSGTYALALQKLSRSSFGIWSPVWIDHYEQEEDFRRWLSGRIRSGTITPAEIERAVFVVRRQPPGLSAGSVSPENNLGDNWYEEYQDSLKSGR